MQKTKLGYWLLLVILAATLAGCSKEKEIPLAKLDEEPAETEEKSEEQIVVYVCGEVMEEGIYTLPADARVYQAIEAAGGMTETAAATYLNQAEYVMDGQSILVPSKEEAEQMKAGMRSAGAKVNLNTATKEELMTLTGIGESKAESILEYRETNGRFQNIEDIKKISGIKEAVFQKIEDEISV